MISLLKRFDKKVREGFGDKVGFCFYTYLCNNGENTDLINKVFGMQ